MGHSVDEFFGVVEKDSAEGKTLPNWCVARSTFTFNVPDMFVVFDCRKGELYLEVSLYLFFGSLLTRDISFIVPSWDVYVPWFH